MEQKHNNCTNGSNTTRINHHQPRRGFRGGRRAYGSATRKLQRSGRRRSSGAVAVAARLRWRRTAESWRSRLAAGYASVGRRTRRRVGGRGWRRLRSVTRERSELGPLSDGSVERVEETLDTLIPMLPEMQYFRFKQVDERCGMELDETDPAVWLKLEAATEEYIQKNFQAFKNVCELLVPRYQEEEKSSEKLSNPCRFLD